MRSIELLSPAKNLQIGIAAINHGADAVYIGASAFGARSAATNSLEDIAKLVQYAHQFHAKVYVTVNTILYDTEIEKAVHLIWQLYDIHVDAIIIQDLGLLECDLPPIAIHASTQLNNRTAEKVLFLEKVGFSQAVLARELNLKQIKEISNKTTIPLEFFIHGALCVCYNGQCYMSEYATGRSGNRGECSQMCRHKYTLEGIGEEQDGYFLSTKDLSLGNKLEDLIDAGISSFKIEGRLKDEDYVVNVTAYYRQKIDAIIAHRNDLQRSSIGISKTSFIPQLDKTFSRGFTEYYIEKRRNEIANIHSPKSQGEYIGKVEKIIGNLQQRNTIAFQINSTIKLHNGDGLCFYDKNIELTGVQVNSVSNNIISLNKVIDIPIGTDIWRNFDILFQKELEHCNTKREIPIQAIFQVINDKKYSLQLIYDKKNSISITKVFTEFAKNQERQKKTIEEQITKLGESIFTLERLTIQGEQVPFIPISEINELRREACNLLSRRLISTHESTLTTQPIKKNTVQYPITEPTDFRLNVANEKAHLFFQHHGIQVIQKAFELEHRTDVPLMTTKYCIRYQLHECKNGNATPIYLSDKSHKFRVEFDCSKCEMNIFSTNN